ncbi:hypothetical protein C5167_037785 [Papaver somniferum]|uniref:COBRA C-terminal domain-containing protein n=1 Tax=Papaver somniferum TaxID=3469 RepID=A0A4Y7I7D0_PAPSO|nr:hypothetical protein C5167_037785 [Papaver somniferum]
MCPIRVYWHVMRNYDGYWRVKLTVTNYKFGTNYSDWNVLVQHPGFKMSPSTYSFNSTLLPSLGFEGDKVALFWGIGHYNSELPQAKLNQEGYVTTEILLGKDVKSFTLRNGWAFPQKVSFNGENCVMPLPDDFPILPSSSFIWKPNTYHLLLLLTVVFGSS